ncbi:hypothetical protein KSZ_78310 [Dictyobacter formicarum]|uniref:Oligopeptide/dipeptide ABC transporter C-terminal domain-containing protein n=1 Tax=Dictyobacter formicarum TaxID=2778368 RepID=A0ABQ3VV04_9CHLR|nr:hypothetical protein KSZ_78310 [Dictyobacter formicarum]
MQDLQESLGPAYRFGTQHLSVVKNISDALRVMYLAGVVELAKRDSLYRARVQPYTPALTSAIPVPDPEVRLRRKRIILEGDVPAPVNPTSGCKFIPRCWKGTAICREVIPHSEEKQSNNHAPVQLPGYRLNRGQKAEIKRLRGGSPL